MCCTAWQLCTYLYIAVLQWVALAVAVTTCCGVLQWVAVGYSVLQCVTVCCRAAVFCRGCCRDSVLRCVLVFCSVLHSVAVCYTAWWYVAVLHCVARGCCRGSVLGCVAVCCIVLHVVAVILLQSYCCSESRRPRNICMSYVLQCVAVCCSVRCSVHCSELPRPLS